MSSTDGSASSTTSSRRPDKKKAKKSHDCSKTTTEWVDWCNARGHVDIVACPDAGKVLILCCMVILG